MKLTRRQFGQAVAVTGAAALTPRLAAPALAQNTNLRIGILAPRAGAAATIGECGLRGVQWGVERINKDGGIAGRKVELVIEEESNPKDTIERFRRLVLQEKVACVQGIVSTGVSLGVAPAAEDERALLMLWDGTTQDGVKETMPNPNYVFRSTDNECEAVMASLLALKHYNGQFRKIAGINPDYSYGRNNWETFQQILKRYKVKYEVVAEQWPKVGTLDLTSNVAALNAAKPDLIFSSMLFADLPVFLKQGHASGLFKDTKLVLPAATWQINQLSKEFIPEGTILGYNTLYFDLPHASPLQKEFVSYYLDHYKEAPHWEADRAYFALAAYKAGVEAAHKAAGKWPETEGVIAAIPGLKIESLGGPGRFRKDKIAEQMFYQGPSTNKNRYSFPTLASVETLSSARLQKPEGVNFWDWIKTAPMPINA
jgi:branched-chain amino acid transport system substrate-binding protein